MSTSFSSMFHTLLYKYFVSLVRHLILKYLPYNKEVSGYSCLAGILEKSSNFKQIYLMRLILLLGLGIYL